MPDNELFLSLIIPIYNVEQFLGECLDSCLEQDIDQSRYEIICVDDGSTDDSGSILDRYAAEHANIIAIHQPNGGVSVARNTGLKAAGGKYLWFVDPDDLIQDHFLKTLLDTVETQQRPDMVTFGVYEFGDYTTDCSLSEDELLHKHELKNNRAPNEQYDATLCRHLYKNEIFSAKQIAFDPKIKVCEDNVVHFVYEGNVRTQAMIPEVGYFYRKRRNSLSSGSAEQYYETRVRIATLFLDYYFSGYGNHYIAGYLLTSQLKMALAHVARMKNPKRRRELKRLRALGLFPLKIDPKNTFFEKKRDETKSINRLYNKSYNSIYTIKGYYLMRWFVLKKKIRNRFASKR